MGAYGRQGIKEGKQQGAVVRRHRHERRRRRPQVWRRWSCDRCGRAAAGTLQQLAEGGVTGTCWSAPSRPHNPSAPVQPPDAFLSQPLTWIREVTVRQRWPRESAA